MAMTREQHEELLAKIMDKVGLDDDDLVGTIEVLRDNYREIEEKPEGDEVWKAKYEDIFQKYKARFFSPPDKSTTGEKIKEDNEEDVKEEEKETTFDDLFKKRED